MDHVPLFVCSLFVFAPSVSVLDSTAVLYVGPDQILPITSVIGAIVGVILMLWNRLVGLALRIRKYLSGE